MNRQNKVKSWLTSRRTWAVILVGIALAAGSLGAQEQPEGSGFIEALRNNLHGQGWTRQETGALARQGVDWRQAEGADPQMVALALQYGKSQADIGPGEQAQLALQLALMTREMEALGYTTRIRTRAALQGTRQVMEQLRTRLAAGGGEGIGDMIRTRLRQQIRLAAHDQTQARLREGERDRLRKRPSDMVLGGPGSGSRGGDSPGGKR